MSEPWSSTQRSRRTTKTTLWSERRGVVKKDLTGPTLLEISDFPETGKVGTGSNLSGNPTSSGCPARLSLCVPASLQTNQREHRELAFSCSVGLKARPGRPRAEKFRFYVSPTRRRNCRGLAPENASARGLRPTDTPPVSGPPSAWRDWHSLAASRGRTAAPASGCSAGPS